MPTLAGKRRAVTSSAAAIGVAILMAAASLGYGLYASSTAGAEISSMSSSLSSQRAEIGNLNTMVSTLQANISSLRGKVVASSAELNSTKATVSTLMGNVTSLQERLAALSDQLNATESAEAADSAVIAQLRGEVQNLNATTQQLSGELNSTQTTVFSLRGNVTSLQEKLVSVSAQLNATESADSAEIAQLQAEVQTLNATIQQLTGTLASPALVQQAESTCSYVCAGSSTMANFSAYVRSGDMLVVTVVSDDLTNLVVTDSMGTRITLAVSATTSPNCISNTGTCQADIYWGVFNSSGPDSVTVSEGSSPRALRVALWEFRGVDAVKSAVSCAPVCASASYSPQDILISTAMNVNGSGSGFTWYPYFASGVAGSEYEVASVAGSTTFPFSTFVTGDINVEAGAVLGPTP